VSDTKTAIARYEAPSTPAVPQAAEVYLARIRPEWQATRLVERVRLLLPVDPSSACQRLLNAATRDIRAKIRVLGLDLAREAAKAFKLPPVESDEDLEEYPTARLYDLAYRLGLLNRAEWRRIHRAYDIRRDLEHEDDEYEASTGDLIYIFETSIDVVLSRYPIQVIQIRDIEEVVESTLPAWAPSDLLQDFTEAPPQRKAEVLQRLAFWSLAEDRPEIVRENSYRLLRQFAPLAPPGAKIELAQKLEQRIGRRAVDLETAQVALISGAYPYIHSRQQHAICGVVVSRFDAVKPDWRQHPHHAELLDDFEAAGAFTSCPQGMERRIVRWLVEAYVGEPGRYGYLGRNRDVFYSNSAAPRIEKLLRAAGPDIKAHVDWVAGEKGIKKLIKVSAQQERLDALVGMTATAPSS
jgi:hypothetical protein